MTRSNYNQKRDAQIIRYHELAEKREIEGESLLSRAHKMVDVIPFGQPILVGHYSEGRDRRYRDRISKTFDKGLETLEQAKTYARRAESAENNTAISSDDPEALQKLKEKLAKLQADQERNKAINKIVHSKKLSDEQKVQKLVSDIGMHESTAKNLLIPDCFRDIGIPSYMLQNNNGNMKRIKDRIAALEREKTQESKEIDLGCVRIVDSLEENRIMIFFSGIPEESVRLYLKQRGFRWSPTNRAWQAYRTAACWISSIVCLFTVMPAYVDPSRFPAAEICGDGA